LNLKENFRIIILESEGDTMEKRYVDLDNLLNKVKVLREAMDMGEMKTIKPFEYITLEDLLEEEILVLEI
jgi:hypothetical protein